MSDHSQPCPSRLASPLTTRRPPARAVTGDHDDPPHPEPPPVLVDALAIEEWHRIAPSMLGQGRFSAVHQALLVGYCAALAKAMRAEEIVALEGAYYQSLGSNGTIIRRRHPAVQDAEKSWSAVRQFARQLGISTDLPSAHSAVRERRAFLK